MTKKTAPGRNGGRRGAASSSKPKRSAASGSTRANRSGKTAQDAPLPSPPQEVSAKGVPAKRAVKAEPSPVLPRDSASPADAATGILDAPAAPVDATAPVGVAKAAVAPTAPVDAAVAEEIRRLEERLGGMIREAEVEEEPPSLREQVSFAAREVVDRLAAPVERPGTDDGGVVDTVRGLLSSDYYLRQWGRIGMRNRSEEVDDFGLDVVYEKRLRPLWDFLYERYFRIESDGIENVPSSGRCLIVANHSGTIPLDGLMLRACLRLEHPAARELRWLAEDFVYHLPFVGAFMSRVGAVRACQENAQRLLDKESAIAVFPEGVKGIGKLYKDRYRLQRFGRGGFIRLCLRTRTPVVPCAVIGAEETSPMLYRDEFVSRAFGLPYLPITPTFPWLGPAGLIPAPTKWRIVFGEALDFTEFDAASAEDNVLVGRLAERVRSAIQQLLDRALGQRRSVWVG